MTVYTSGMFSSIDNGGYAAFDASNDDSSYSFVEPPIVQQRPQHQAHEPEHATYQRRHTDRDI